MRDSELVERLLEQNARLIEALAGSSPVEVIRALNPPVVVNEAPVRQPAEGEWLADLAQVREVPDGWEMPLPAAALPDVFEMPGDGA